MSSGDTSLYQWNSIIFSIFTLPWQFSNTPPLRSPYKGRGMICNSTDMYIIHSESKLFNLQGKTVRGFGTSHQSWKTILLLFFLLCPLGVHDLPLLLFTLLNPVRSSIDSSILDLFKFEDGLFVLFVKFIYF